LHGEVEIERPYFYCKPCISYKPHAFGFFKPTGWLRPSARE
jgi:hypothetical protein